MSPSHILEPTYRAIKQRLMYGEWSAGSRLDTARLAADLGVSTSPVRDSLNRLAGERMVDFEPGEGFHVPRLDEKGLQDLLDLNLHLLLAAIPGDFAFPRIDTPAEDLAVRAAACFSRMAKASGNGELYAAIAALNDRLAAVRRLDAAVLVEPTVELDALDQSLAAQAHPRSIRDTITSYHVVRKLHAAGFVRLLAIEATDLD